MDVDYDGAEYDSARGTMQEGPSQNLDESLPGTKLYANPEYEVPLTPVCRSPDALVPPITDVCGCKG